MKAIYGLYSTPQSAEHAFKELRRAGVSEENITVMSSEPLDDYELGTGHRSTAMPWLAVLGGAIGLTVAWLLTSLTQQSWPINTGGMPTVTNWTNIIIMYELTMLGAALATVITLFVSARLPSRLPEFYDPSIADGMILVGVTNPPQSSATQIEDLLRSTGAEFGVRHHEP
jgi:hypothetical protein